MSVKLRRGQNDKEHWEVDRLWPDGTRYRRRSSQEVASRLDQRIAEAIALGYWRKLRDRLLAGRDRIKGLTFRKLCKIYLKQYVATQNRAERHKRCHLGMLKRTFGNLPIDALASRHVTIHVNRRKRNGASTATVNRDIATLKHMLGWAAREGIVKSKAVAWVRDVQRGKEIVVSRPRATDEVLDQIFAKLDERVVSLFTFIRETGCRREEALSLKRRQLDLVRAEVTFSGNTKSGKARTVPLTDEALMAIEAVPVVRQTEYVFYHPDTLARWHDCKKPWLAAVTAAVEAGHKECEGLWVKDMRAAYAIKLAEAGTPMHFIQAMLGHSSVNLTQKHYARFSPDSASDRVRAQLKLIRSGKERAKKAG